MSREVFYDKLLVSDSEFDLSELESTYKYLKGLTVNKGSIGGDISPDETAFMLYSSKLIYYMEDLEEENLAPDLVLLKKVMGMDLVPIPEKHTIDMRINAHEMTEGGGMSFHNDSNYSCAVSIYLNSVEGGEFQARFEGSNNINLIVEVSPQAGRAVVVKAETEHRVAKVTKGTRRNIQIFITYTRDEE